MPKIYTPEILDQYFGGIETQTRNNINRGDLITVDGMTIHQMMADEYFNNWKDPGQFASYYEEHVREYTQKYVKEALQKGKYVEVFPVEQTYGELSGEPEQLHLEGTEPTLPQGADAGKIQKSREQVQMINYSKQYKERVLNSSLNAKLSKVNNVDFTDSNSVKQVFGENKTVERFPLGRCSFASFTTLLMASRNYTIADIFSEDPKMTEIRNNCSREIMQYLKENDVEALARLTVDGMQNMLEQIDERMKNIDLSSNKDLTDPKNMDVCQAVVSIFDGLQNIKPMQAEVNGVCDEKQPEEETSTRHPIVLDFERRAWCNSTLLKSIGHYIMARGDLLNGERKNPDDVLLIVNAEIVRKKYADYRAKYPDEPFSYSIPDEEVNDIAEINVMKDDDEDNMKLEIVEDYHSLRKIGQELVSGEFQNSLNIQFGKKPGEVLFNLQEFSELKDIADHAEERAELHQKVKQWGENLKEVMEQDLAEGCRNYCERFAGSVKAAIQELKDADPALMISSKQYKEMRAGADRLAEVMNKIGDLPEEKRIDAIRSAIAQVKEKAQEYLRYKKADEAGINRSSGERKRILAARRLLELENRMEFLADSMPEYAKVAAERKTISNQLEKYCGAQASDIYRIPGSMLETKMLIDEEGVMHEETVSVMDKLKQEIMSNKELLISYAVDKKPISGDEMAALRRQMAHMVAMEFIASERMKKGYCEGQKRVTPGAFEKAYADNPEKCLEGIEKTNVFQYAMGNMTPEDMLTLYEEDGAKVIADTLVQEAVKKDRMRENEKANEAGNDMQTVQKKQSDVSVMI